MRFDQKAPDGYSPFRSNLKEALSTLIIKFRFLVKIKVICFWIMKFALSLFPSIFM